MIKKIIRKIPLAIFIFAKLSMLIALFFALWQSQWLNSLAIFGIFSLISLPWLFEKKYNIRIPFEFELVSVIFVYLAVFLGNFKDYYFKFWWWDVCLHLISGFLLGILGFTLVYILNDSKKVRLNMKAGFVALFAVTFAVTIGVFWEFFEFFLDALFNFNNQPSLRDTMWDLIMDTIGAFVMSSLGYLWMKERIRFFIFDQTLKRFVNQPNKKTVK